MAISKLKNETNESMQENNNYYISVILEKNIEKMWILEE